MKRQMQNLVSTSKDMLAFIRNNVQMPEVEELLHECCNAWQMIIERAEDALKEQEYLDAHPPAPKPYPVLVAACQEEEYPF